MFGYGNGKGGVENENFVMKCNMKELSKCLKTEKKVELTDNFK